MNKLFASNPRPVVKCFCTSTEARLISTESRVSLLKINELYVLVVELFNNLISVILPIPNRSASPNIDIRVQWCDSRVIQRKRNAVKAPNLRQKRYQAIFINLK